MARETRTTIAAVPIMTPTAVSATRVFRLPRLSMIIEIKSKKPSSSDQPLETAFPEEQQNIIPVQPPLKGP